MILTIVLQELAKTRAQLEEHLALKSQAPAPSAASSHSDQSPVSRELREDMIDKASMKSSEATSPNRRNLEARKRTPLVD